MQLRSLSLFLAGLLLAGCRTPSSSLRIGANVWPGFEPLFLAHSLGYYDGQPIRLVDFPSSAEIIRAYRNRAIDIAAVTADEALQVTEKLSGQRIVLVCDFSNGADVILTKPHFPSMKDLYGRRIGVEQNALGAYTLARALEISGMKAGDIIVVPVPLEEHESAYAADQVDAVVTFEPRRTRLLAAGARQVFDSSQIPGEIVDVLLTRQELVEADGDTLTALVHGWFRSLDYLRRHPQDAARRLAPREQVRPEDFLQSLQGLELPDHAANLRLLGRSTGSLEGALRRLQTVMIQNQLLSRTQDVAVLLDDRIVRKGAP